MSRHGEVFILSNAADMLPKQIHLFYNHNGFNIKLENIITSGMALKPLLKSLDLVDKNVLCIGNEATQEYIRQAGAKSTSNPLDIDASVLSCRITDENISQYLKAVDFHRKFKKPFILADPDMYIPSSNNKLINGPGIYAKVFELIANTEIIKVGKPYPLIYDIAKRLLNEMGIEFKDVLAIGDTWETDILGGSKNGFDTLLVLSGVAGILFKDHLEKLDKLEPKPKYILSSIF